jgi:hypothetical protein
MCGKVLAAADESGSATHGIGGAGVIRARKVLCVDVRDL